MGVSIAREGVVAASPVPPLVRATNHPIVTNSPSSRTVHTNVCVLYLSLICLMAEMPIVFPSLKCASNGPPKNHNCRVSFRLRRENEWCHNLPWFSKISIC